MDGFIGEIRAFSFNYVPQGWLLCNGDLLAVNNFSTLFAVIGYTYGGSGATFQLPNINGKTLVGQGELHYGGVDSGSYYQIGEKQNGDTIVLNYKNMPPHKHAYSVCYIQGAQFSQLVKVPAAGYYLSNSGTNTTPVINGKSYVVPATPPTDCSVLAPGAIGYFGSANPQGHNNMQPYLVMNYCICLEGYFPVKP